jgi:hypothetical protein
MSILLLEVETWILEVKNHGEGFQVSIVEDTKPATTHCVRLDREQSETLRQFMNEASPVTNGPQV